MTMQASHYLDAPICIVFLASTQQTTWRSGARARHRRLHDCTISVWTRSQLQCRSNTAGSCSAGRPVDRRLGYTLLQHTWHATMNEQQVPVLRDYRRRGVAHRRRQLHQDADQTVIKRLARYYVIGCGICASLTSLYIIVWGPQGWQEFVHWYSLLRLPH